MTKTNLAPALDYYTLKQAANELNVFFNRSDIDESYLVHLGAAGKIKLSIATFGKKTIAVPINVLNEEINLEHHALLMALTENMSFYLFYNVHSASLRKLSAGNDARCQDFRDFFIYDPYRIMDNPQVDGLLSSYSMFGIGAATKKEIKDGAYEKLRQLKRINNTPFLDNNLFAMNDAAFGIGDDDVAGRVFKLYNKENNKYGFEYLQNLTITKNDLFIIRPELDRIINNNLRTLTLKDIPSNTLKRSDIDVLMEYILIYLKDKKYDVLNLPKGKKGIRGIPAELRDYFEKVGVSGGSTSIEAGGDAYKSNGSCDKALKALLDDGLIKYTE